MSVDREPADTDVLHVAVGPERHGVVRHASAIAGACGQPLLRLDRQEAADPQSVLNRISPPAVVHIAYTDRLFADNCEESADAFQRLAEAFATAGSAVSVTLHDLPAGSSPLEVRRREAYRMVVATADGIVVNSARELRLLGEMPDTARSVRCIPLPVERAVVDGPPGPADRNVVVLGFLYPDRGYEHTLAELPEGIDLVALGEPSAGHDGLPSQLAASASAAGRRFTVTGFVPDDDLPQRLRSAGVPVAPNRRVAASGSIAEWLGHGRRPLVPVTPYTQELAARWPGTLGCTTPMRLGRSGRRSRSRWPTRGRPGSSQASPPASLSARQRRPTCDTSPAADPTSPSESATADGWCRATGGICSPTTAHPNPCR